MNGDVAGDVGRAGHGWWRALRWLPSVVVLAVLGWLVSTRWDALPEDGRLPAWWALGVAVVLNVVGNVLLADTWRVQVLLTGQELGRRRAVGIWSTSQFARLLFPGATIGARTVLGVRAGVSGPVTAATTVLETVWSLLSQPLIIVLTMPWWVRLAPELRWAGLAAVGPVLVLVALVAAPMPALRVAAGLLRRLPMVGRRMPSAERLEAASIGPRTSGGLGLRYLTIALLRDASFLLLVATLHDLDAAGAAATVGAVALGRLVGLLAVFAPMGLGPREGVTVLVLAPVTGAAVAIVAVAAARLAEVVAEGLTWLGSRDWGATGSAVGASSAPTPAEDGPSPS